MEREIHAWSTVGLAIATTALYPAYDGALLVASGVWLGILLHPDLDQSETPYGKVRKHRGLSHWPIVGTADRLLWFCWPLLLLVDWKPFVPVAVGLAFADILHILLDVLDDKLRRRGVNL